MPVPVGHQQQRAQFFTDELGGGPNVSLFARLDGPVYHVPRKSSFHGVARIPKLNGFHNHRFGVRHTACEQQRSAEGLTTALFEV
jgi:hypothetical protein